MYSRPQIVKNVASLLEEGIIPILFFIGMYFFFPFRDVFWMDLDEGINLVKAQMVLRGYPLYSQVWSDQPPFLTHLLAGFLRFFGMEASVGRLLILLLSSGFLWAYIHYLRIVWGVWHAACGVILLLFVPRFTELSVSVMVGLPAIIFAAFSMLALTYWHLRGKIIWLILAALFLALSVLTKGFTAFLAPIFFLGIVYGEYAHASENKFVALREPRKKDVIPSLHSGQALSEAKDLDSSVAPLPQNDRSKKDARILLRTGLIWGIVWALAIALPVLILVRPANFDQLLGAHLEAAVKAVYRNDPQYGLSAQLVDARPLLLLALLGIAAAVISRRWLALYPAAWMVAAYLLLWRHVPVWSHQQLLITLPAALMASGAAGDALTRLAKIIRSRVRFAPRDLLHLASLGVFVYLLAVRVPPVAQQFNHAPILAAPRYKPTTTEAKFMKTVLQYAPQTRWIVTDIPMYAFYADLPVPPDLVVFSSKRLETGNLTEEEIIQTIQEVGAEQVLLGRYELPKVREYLKQNYQLVQSKELIELYVSRDILSDSQPP
jgi:hypothetical protein